MVPHGAIGRKGKHMPANGKEILDLTTDECKILIKQCNNEIKLAIQSNDENLIKSKLKSHNENFAGLDILILASETTDQEIIKAVGCYYRSSSDLKSDLVRAFYKHTDKHDVITKLLTTLLAIIGINELKKYKDTICRALIHSLDRNPVPTLILTCFTKGTTLYQIMWAKRGFLPGVFSDTSLDSGNLEKLVDAMIKHSFIQELQETLQKNELLEMNSNIAKKLSKVTASVTTVVDRKKAQKELHHTFEI